jgi:nickel/cobalt transporter (NiCoT) family protein
MSPDHPDCARQDYTIEILGQEYNLSGGFWSFMQNFDINKAGLVIIGIFVVTWAVALSVWPFGHIEDRWDVTAAKANANTSA